MSKTVFITYSDDRSGRKGGLYGKTQGVIEGILWHMHFPDFEQKHFTYFDLEKTEFFTVYKDLLSQVDPAKNGRAFKPYFIYRELFKLSDGDFLIYNDCSPELWEHVDKSVKYDIDIAKIICTDNNDIVVPFVKWHHRTLKPFEYGIHTHRHFTLNSCLKIMDAEHYKDSFLCASGMIIIRKCESTLRLAEEWLKYNLIPECSCMNMFETEDNYHDGVAGKKLGNRHDQSVLSVLLNKKRYKYVDCLSNDMNPFNFLQFCRPGIQYNFLESNHPL